jgi:regulator of replication initiation timing
MKDVNSLKGIHGAATMQSRKKRSIPRVQSSTYLDLYMLDKEKERLLKEDGKLSMRKDGIRKRLEEIECEVSKTQKAESITKAAKSTNSSGRTFAQTKGTKKEFKTMALTY